MDFDHLLRKYLAGTLSQQELAEFRELLERTPEYKAELKQTLDLRSLVHDDMLHLTPPVELSDRVRVAVGRRFAFAGQTEEEEERRRRGLFVPFRIGSAVLAGVAAILIAVSPLLREPFVAADNAADVLRTDGIARLDINRFSTAPAFPESNAPAVDINIEETEVVTESAVTRRAPSRRTVTAPAESELRVSPSESTLAEAAPIPTIPAAPVDRAVLPAEGIIPSNGENRMIAEADEQPTGNVERSRIHTMPSTIDSDGGRLAIVNAQSNLPQSIAATTPSILAVSGDAWRRFSFGVAVGSGRSTNNSALTPLMQNSYYLSFGLNSSDRIGVEMGASSFGEGGPFGTIPAGPLAKGTAQGSGEVGEADSSQVLRFTGQLQATTPEQKVTYGSVFYDRRFEVSDSWDFCGRVGVGGAEDAVIGNLRAYAAFSPSPNVTLTLGAGGTIFHNINAKGSGTVGNYGIYYGIETGF